MGHRGSSAWRRLSRAGLALLTFAAIGAAQTSAVESVIIKSEWTGMGYPKRTQVEIRRQKDGSYYGASQSWDARLVQDLVDALKQPPSVPTPAGFGIDAEWLKNGLEVVRRGGGPPRYQRDYARHWDEFAKAFTDATRLRWILPGVVSAFWTDDYPMVDVAVTFLDGQTLQGTTHAPGPFMLPWRLQSGTVISTPALSRAVAALMPAGVLNRDRLMGGDFVYALAARVRDEVQVERVQPLVQGVKATYSDVTVAVMTPYAVYPGKEWIDPRGEKEVVALTLRRAQYPNTFLVRALAPLDTAAATTTAQQIVQSGESLAKLALQVEWLRREIEQKQQPVDLLVFGTRSLSSLVISAFQADMRGAGNTSLAEEVAAAGDHVAVLSVLGSYWLVLPDERVVMWRYVAPIGLLNWTAEQLQGSRCATGLSGWTCAGAVISPAGELLRRN